MGNSAAIEEAGASTLLQTVQRLEGEVRLREGLQGMWAVERSLLRAMIEQVPDFLFAKDRQGRFLVVNQAVATIHGLTQPELIGLTDFDLHTPELAAAFFAVEQGVMRSGVPVIDAEECVLDAEGNQRWVATSKVALRDDRQAIIGLVGISRDITARKKADSLREGQALVLERIAMNAPLAEVLTHLVELIEAQLDGVIGSVLLIDEEGLRLRHGAAPNLPAAYAAAIDGILIGPKVGSCGTAAFRHQPVVVSDIATDPLWEDYRHLAAAHELGSCWSTPILSHHGVVLGTFAMYTKGTREPTVVERNLADMTSRIAAIAIERQRAEDKISFLAHHDALTGLPNRSLFTDRLTQAMLRTQRYDPWVSVVFVDLDNFKVVNDSLGHTTGDTLLKIVATRLLACVKPTDTVIRLGGDEFVILIVDQPDNSDALSVTLDEIRAAIAVPVPLAGQAIHITCSMGVATFPQDGTNAEALLMNADAAMYKAKEAGRDGFRFYTAEMNTQVHERLRLQEAMRDGIGRNDFYLLYQPQVDLRTGRIFAVEALVRWQHPTLGLLSPTQFIPLAEETGLIVPLGDWVLRQACSQNKAWQDAGLPPINVSVNVSARQFHEKSWIDRVRRVLQESGMPATFLELELTESLLMRDIDQAIATMKALQAFGVHFAIDDFGTGYSSLSSLKNLPAERLKIDKSFIRNLAHDESDRGIAAAVIELGQRLDMRVLAEGVETAEQLAVLRASGCDEVQGYYFGKPLRVADVEARLRLQALQQPA